MTKETQTSINFVGNTAVSIDELAIINGINQASQLAYSNAYNAGWYTDLETGKAKEINDGERIALMHSELSEALEGIRKPGPDEHLPQYDKVTVELADTLIRIFDHAAYRNLPIAEAVIAKMRYNKERADHKIENRMNKGKQF